MADKRTIAQLDRLTLETASPDPTLSVGLPVSGIDTVIAEIRNRRHGRPSVDEEWWCTNLSLDEFNLFKVRIEADEDLWGYFADKIKYDYFPDLAKFVLRMGHYFQQAVVEGFNSLLIKQLFDIERSNDQIAADFARDVYAAGSPGIESDGGVHCPDKSFGHKDATELGVILEVSHSLKREYLPFLTDEYILGSNGLTQVVIGIDLEYRKNKAKEARVIVWRPTETKENGKTILATKKIFERNFRDTDGNLVNGEQNLQIGLQDFGNKLDCPGIQKVQGAITISFAQLHEVVQESEAFACKFR